MKTNLSIYLRRWMLVALWLAGASACAQAPDPWQQMQREHTGPEEVGVMARLRQHGFTPDQADQMLACLATARSQQLPLAPLTSRLEEGLAKNVDPQNIVAAIQARLNVQTQARAQLQAAHFDPTPGSPQEELLAAAVLALESGLPAEDLAAILQRGNGRNALRIKSVVEAGESLCLAGVDRATTQALMNDCLDRDLRRMEMLRAVRYSVQQHRGGMSGETLRRSLWGGNAAIEDGPGRHGHGSGQGGRGAAVDSPNRTSPGASGMSGGGVGAGGSGAGATPPSSPLGGANDSGMGSSGSGPGSAPSGSGSSSGSGSGPGGPAPNSGSSQTAGPQ